MSYSEAFGPALVIQHTGQVFPLAQEPVTIGCEADNSLILADPEVSGHHAIISWQSDVNIYVIQDLGSANGLKLNGVRIRIGEVGLLEPGDHLWLGGCVLAYDIER